MNLSLVERVRYAWRGVRHRWVLAILNVVAVAVTLVYLIIPGYYGLELYAYQKRVTGDGLTTLVVATCRDSTDRTTRITDDRVREFRRWPEVRLAFPRLELLVNVAHGPANNTSGRLVTAIGTVPDDPAVASSRLAWGTPPADSTGFEVVVSESLLRDLGFDPSTERPEVDSLCVSVSRTVQGREEHLAERLRIVGVLQAGARIDAIYLPWETLDRLDQWCTSTIATWPTAGERRQRDVALPTSTRPRSMASLGRIRCNLYARDDASVRSLVRRLEELGFRTEHRLAEQEGLSQMARALVVVVALLLFGSLVNAVVTVAVTSMMTVHARSWEIGLLRARGLSAGTVGSIFRLQGGIGGLMAFALGTVGVFAVEPVLRELLSTTLRMPMDQILVRSLASPGLWWLYLTALAIAMCTCLIALAIPTHCVCRRSPIELLVRAPR